MQDQDLIRASEEHRDSRRETTNSVLCTLCYNQAFFTKERKTSEGVYYVYKCKPCGINLEKITIAVPQKLALDPVKYATFFTQLAAIINKIND